MLNTITKPKYLFIVVIAVLSLVSSCTYLIRKPDSTEQNRINNPVGADKVWLQKNLKPAINWAKKTEARFYSKGRVLTKKEIEIATKMGVLNPNKIRITVVEKLPLPEDKNLLKQAKKLGFGSSLMIGLTLGKVVLIKNKKNVTIKMLSHEFVHIKQFEQLGYKNFFRQYLMELRVVGYARAPLEDEAYNKQL